MAIILATTNRKGGVGKTTHALTIGAGLATMGYRVGIVDTDSQGHIAKSLGTPRKDSLFDVLVREKDFVVGEPTVETRHIKEDGAVIDEYEVVTYQDESATVFRASPMIYSKGGEAKGELFVLPSSDRTWRIAGELNTQNRVFGFLEAMEKFAENLNLQVLMIDTSPTLKELDALVTLAIDGYIYVTEPEALSVDGVSQAIDQVKKLAKTRESRLGRKTRVVGILPNKVRHTDLHEYYFDGLCEKYGDAVMSPVFQRIKWGEASGMNETIYRYAPGSSAEKEAWQIVREVVQRIQEWAKTE